MVVYKIVTDKDEIIVEIVEEAEEVEEAEILEKYITEENVEEIVTKEEKITKMIVALASNYPFTLFPMETA